MEYKLEFITDYGQFYISDKNSIGNTSSMDFWNDQAFTDKLAVGNDILDVSIHNEIGMVKFSIAILEMKSSIVDFVDFDHVVEASIRINSGVLQVLDCPFSEIIKEINLENGEYRVRVNSINLKISYDLNPNDEYKIEIWKEDYSERVVLKRYLE